MSVYCWTSVNLVSSQIIAFRANSIELNCNDLSTTDSIWIDFYSSDIILPSKISYCTLKVSYWILELVFQMILPWGTEKYLKNEEKQTISNCKKKKQLQKNLENIVSTVDNKMYSPSGNFHFPSMCSTQYCKHSSEWMVQE